MHDLESTKKSITQGLRDVASQVLELTPTATASFFFDTSQLTSNAEPPFLRQVSNWITNNDERYIYYFRIIDDSDIEQVYSEYEKAKKEKKADRAYARLNCRSRYLYVGGSEDIRRRIEEHLGRRNKATYAMQLAYWSENLTMKIEFHCMKFSKSVDPKVLQALEDGLWEELKPMLGRKGAR